MARTCAWLALFLLGCGSVPDTRLSIVVESEFSAPAEIDRIDIVVDAISIGGQRQTASVDLSAASDRALPARLGLSYGGGGAPLGPFIVTATGLLAEGGAVASDRVEASFVENQAPTITLHLRRSCEGVVCGDLERCVAGECEPLLGDAGLSDAGLSDAGPSDAGSDAGPIDAGPRDAGAMCVAPFDECEPGEPLCETNLQEERAHCGRCGNDCRDLPNTRPGGTRCEAGRCELSRNNACEGDYEDCNNDPTDGCESNPNFDPMNCNECGRDCVAIGEIGANAVAGCDGSGSCFLAGCDPGFADCDDDRNTGCECEGTCNGNDDCVPAS